MRLRELREERALSQENLAEMSGVARDTIGQLERGERKARPSTLRRLANALRVEPSELAAEPSIKELKERLAYVWSAQHGKYTHKQLLLDVWFLRRKLGSGDPGDAVEFVELVRIDEQAKELVRDLNERLDAGETLPAHYQGGVLGAVQELLGLHAELFRVLAGDPSSRPAGSPRAIGTHYSEEPEPQRRYPDAVPRTNISERQQNVLITVLEGGEVSISDVAERLRLSISTAYRDLSVLEEHGLVVAAESGKRQITPLGRDLVEAIVGAIVDDGSKEASRRAYRAWEEWLKTGSSGVGEVTEEPVDDKRKEASRRTAWTQWGS